jgi:hypothetical protein
MKIIRILSVTILFFSQGKSQITKGNWMLGGNVSYASTDYNSENYGAPHKYYKLQVNPNIGYFLIDKLASGLKTGIEKTGAPGANNSHTNFNIGPYLRYYWLKPESPINIISEGNYQYGFDKFSNAEKVSKNTFSFSAGPVVYFNTVVGLEFLISYSTYKFSEIKGSNNTLMVGLGLQVHLEREKSLINKPFKI